MKKYSIKLKCPQCNQVKRTLFSGQLLNHKQTIHCPDCDTKMYSYESNAGNQDYIDRPGLNPNFFEELNIPFYIPKDH